MNLQSFFRPTVGTILSRFDRLSAELEAACDRHAKAAANYRAAAEKNRLLASSQSADAARAATVAAKVRALVS